MDRELRKKQRLAALEVAHERRRERAVLKAKLRAGEVDPWALIRGELAEHEPTIQTWTLRQLLICVPRIGDARIHEILAAFSASPLLKVRALGDERRVMLARLARQSVEDTVSDYERG